MMIYQIKTKKINGENFMKIDVKFLVLIHGSYKISLFSHTDRTKKSSMDSMKSYMILV